MYKKEQVFLESNKKNERNGCCNIKALNDIDIHHHRQFGLSWGANMGGTNRYNYILNLNELEQKFYIWKSRVECLFWSTKKFENLIGQKTPTLVSQGILLSQWKKSFILWINSENCFSN